MSKSDDLTLFLSRADRLATAFDIKRALQAWEKTPRETLDPQVEKILSDSENMRIARALVQRIGSVKKTLLSEIGPALREELQKRLDKSDAADDWTLKRVGDESWTKQWAGQGLFSKRAQNLWEIPGLYVCVQRASNSVHLGINRTYKKVDHLDWEIDELKELETFLRQRGYHRHIFWLGFRRLFDLREDEFFLEISASRVALVKDIADGFWSLFKESQERLERTNLELEHLVAPKDS